jgi:hypothetical protein
MSSPRESPYRVGGQYRPTRSFRSSRDTFRVGDVLTFVREARRDADALTSYVFSDEGGTLCTFDVPDDMPSMALYQRFRAVEARDGGCPECRRAAVRGMYPPLRQHAQGPGPVLYYRCGRCDALWEENTREAHIVWDRLLTCPHLQALERDLRATGVHIGWEGKYEEKRGLWVYFSVRLDPAIVRQQYDLPDFVEYDEWNGRAAGADAGFQCMQCESAIQGVHPSAASGFPVFPTAMDARVMDDFPPPQQSGPLRPLWRDLLPLALLVSGFALAIAFGWWAGKRA